MNKKTKWIKKGRKKYTGHFGYDEEQNKKIVEHTSNRIYDGNKAKFFSDALDHFTNYLDEVKKL